MKNSQYLQSATHNGSPQLESYRESTDMDMKFKGNINLTKELGETHSAKDVGENTIMCLETSPKKIHMLIG